MASNLPIFGATADVHAHPFGQYARIDEQGVNSRLLRTCEALDWTMTETVKSGAKDFVVAGDLCHVRKEVPTQVLHMVSNILEKHSKNLRIHLLEGNHDQNSSSNHTSIAAFNGMANIIHKPSAVKMSDGTVVGFIPWTDDQSEVQTMFASLYKKGCRHFVAHLGIDGAKLGPSNIEIPGHINLEGAIPAGIKWVILGHYHKPQIVSESPMIRYIGSPLQHNRGERNEDKGFILAYPDKLKFVTNTFSPRFVDVEDSTELSEIRPTDYVRIVAKNKKEAAAITQAVQESVGEQESDAIVDIQSPVEIKQRLKLTGLDTKKMLMKYIEHMPAPEGVDAQKLRDIGMSILTGSGV